jgi:rubrerythrin
MSGTLPRPLGSAIEEALLEHVANHITNEQAALVGYARLAEQSPDEYVRYLASLILEDERRHHKLLLEMRNRVESDVTWRETAPQTPRVTVPSDREQLAEQIEAFLDVEEADAEELRRLRRKMRPLRETSLLSLMVEIMELDTQKHLRILEFIRRSAL